MSNCFRSTAGYKTVGLTPFFRRRRNVWLKMAAVKELLTSSRSALPGRGGLMLLEGDNQAQCLYFRLRSKTMDGCKFSKRGRSRETEPFF